MVAAVDDGSRFNDQKEQEVTAIAAAAAVNQGNCCKCFHLLSIPYD